MSPNPSAKRAPLRTLFLWGVPVLCSLFFATELLLVRQSSAATQPAPAHSPKELSKPTIATTAVTEVLPAPATPLLTPQQIDELLASIPKFSDRPVWERRAVIIGLDQKYKNLFVQLSLDSAKIAQLRELLIERENARSRMHIALAKTGMPVMEVLSATKDVLQRYDQKIEQCLGPDNYAIFAHREKCPGNYAILDDVIGNLSVTEHPLADDKKRELFAAVRKTTNDEAFMATIAQTLRPEQSQVLLDLIEAQTLQDELSKIRMEIYQRNQTSAPSR